MARAIVHYSFPKGAKSVRARLRKRLKEAGLLWDGAARFDGKNLDSSDVALVLDALKEAAVGGQPLNHIWLFIDDSD